MGCGPASTSAVSKKISEVRKRVLSADYTFLLAWKNIGKSAPPLGSPKKVDHRAYHFDRLYDAGETEPAP
jgi:hypothetical protein